LAASRIGSLDPFNNSVPAANTFVATDVSNADLPQFDDGASPPESPLASTFPALPEPSFENTELIRQELSHIEPKQWNVEETAQS